MADQTEMHDRISAMEYQLQQLLTSMQLMTAQIQSLRADLTPALAFPEVVVPKQEYKTQMSNNDMPELEDNPRVIAKLDNVPKTKQDQVEVMDTLGQPSGKFDYLVKYSAPPSFYFDSRNIVPSGWDDMDDLTSPKTENSDDALEGITGLFDDLFIGTNDEGPSEDMDVSLQE